MTTTVQRSCAARDLQPVADDDVARRLRAGAVDLHVPAEHGFGRGSARLEEARRPDGQLVHPYALRAHACRFAEDGTLARLWQQAGHEVTALGQVTGLEGKTAVDSANAFGDLESARALEDFVPGVFAKIGQVLYHFAPPGEL